MDVTANGDVVDVPEGASVAWVLDTLGLGGRVVVVERNGEPVDRRLMASVILRSGDRLEIVRAVAGG